MIIFFRKNINLFLLAVILLFFAGCKEKFTSPAPPATVGYLVVEGVLNNDGDQTNIYLSRTAGLSDTASAQPESGAIVMLEDDGNNTTLQLYESGAGKYTFGSIHLDTTHTYRLKISTANNEVYQSDFVKVKYNPPIDNLEWARDKDGVQIFVNTHDPSNNARYYQWDFNETWEFHSPYVASLKWTVTPGPPATAIWGVDYRDANDPQISICWQSNASSNINLGSSAKLTQDVIHLPLVRISAASWKLSVLYSVLVKQYVWSKEGYEFLERMKKNTESVGSVFDAQPSQLNSNIHCTSNPNLPAIGFFNICTIRENRIFIKNTEVPEWNYKSECLTFVVVNNSDSIKLVTQGDAILPVNPQKLGPFGNIASVNVSTATCVDCRLSGTNIKPDFWP